MKNCSHLGFNNVKCKKFNHIYINENSYCLNHAMLLYNRYAVLIQSHYRGYKARRKLTNIFYNLPTDLQHIIIGYISEAHYIQKYTKTIQNIIEKKNYDFHNFYFQQNNKLSIDYLYNCYRLYSKYHNIIHINYLKHSFFLGEQILHLCDVLLGIAPAMVTNDMYAIYDKIQLYNLDEDSILNLMGMICRFSEIYKCINYIKVPLI